MKENEIINVLESCYETMSICIGSSEECRKHNEAISQAINAVKEVALYRSIGTVEDCRAAVGKQSEKKPVRIDLCTCPKCGTYNEIIKKRRNTVSRDTVYCWHCGQAILVEESED